MSGGIAIKTGSGFFDGFYGTVKNFMLNDISVYNHKGRAVKGYRSPDTNLLWLRDHTHQMKGFKHWETDMKSLPDFFLESQMENGAFYDAYRGGLDAAAVESRRRMDAMMGRKNGVVTDDGDLLFRCGVEADLEYLAAEAVHTVWRTTGDDEWAFSKLTKLERGLNYSMTDPERWDEKHKLVKRPFTIDTWDFEHGKPVPLPGGKSIHRSEIDGDTRFCVMHGDNSGMFQACGQLAQMFKYFGDDKKAGFWSEKAAEFRERTNKLCWNGDFYTHQIHLDEVRVEGVDEARQLSLSNTYDMNRGLPEHWQCVKIIEEYLRRKKSCDSFAEWFSIDPPFPDGSLSAKRTGPGYYVNGGIMPLVGGELARACFGHGFEVYGADILRRYYDMIKRTGKTYLWYLPDGRSPVEAIPGISEKDMLPTDGWGSSAMLAAFVEGLCGVTDKERLMEHVKISPRWAAIDEKNAFVSVGYECSGAFFEYDFRLKTDRIEIDFRGSGKTADFHVLLPAGTKTGSVFINASRAELSDSVVESSHYADFKCGINPGTNKINIGVIR